MEVQAIKNQSDINAIHRVLTKWGNVREAEAFIIGVNVSLRISDLRNLRFDEMDGPRVELNEIKTGKYKEITISEPVRKAVERLRAWYKEKYPYDQPVYLFQAMGNRVKSLDPKPISSTYLYNKLNEATEAIGLDGNFGTHTMRKTFGYHRYINNMPIKQLQRLLNHGSESTTLSYIGYTQEEDRQSYHDFAIDVG